MTLVEHDVRLFAGGNETFREKWVGSRDGEPASWGALDRAALDAARVETVCCDAAHALHGPFTTGHIARSVLIDAFESKFTTDDAQGYPKHFPRGRAPYFEDMSAWSGDSGGVKHVKVRLPGMAGTSIQMRWEYTQDSGGICSDVRPGHSCGVLLDNIVMRSEKIATATP